MNPRRRMILPGLVTGLLLSGVGAAPVSAQSAPPADSTAVTATAPEGEIQGMKSGTTALLLSFLGTAVPSVVAGLEVWEGSSDSEVPGAIFVGALVIGPSLGHFYSDRPGRALVGIGIRTLAGAGVAAAILGESDEGDDNDLEALGIVCAVVGSAAAVWDIVDAPHSAHVHNEQLRATRVGMGLIPTSDGVGLGLRADITF